MCGIVGTLVFQDGSFAITEPYIAAMRDAMSHRGPDGVGVWISPDARVGLGHRRLSIIDLSESANQPMTNEDGSLWIIFNGEIYNHAEIRCELEKRGGHQWTTDHSDTEVILHAFEEWGIDCIHRMRGMFAFALWDARSREMWLVRDRIGIKPLYYSVHDNRIVFGSEIKALLQDPDQVRTVNEEAFYHFLSFLTTPAPQTLFAGIHKLPGGTWLRIKEDGSLYEHRYWDVLEHTESFSVDDEEQIVERLLSELRTSVQLRKVSDVPVGVFLSGGIDSSTNAALFSEDEIDQVKTFTIGYHGDFESYRNETAYASLMAQSVGADHHELLLSVDDLLEFLPEMIRLQDEPIADPVCIPVYYVSKLARDSGVTVCQVGEGADELFWGYPSWKNYLRLQQWNDLPAPALIKQTALRAVELMGKKRTRPYEYLRRGLDEQPIFWGGAEVFTDTHKKHLLSPRLQEQYATVTSWDEISKIWNRYEAGAEHHEPLQWMSYVDLNYRLPELLLMRVDKMSMGVSLESRVPFLDHEFVSLVMGIPQQLKTKNGQLKYLLKKAVRGLIPDEIIDRPKQGFGVPVAEWFFEGLGDRMRQELDEFISITDFFDKDAVDDLFKQGRSQEIWYLLNFALWWKEYIR